jgi:hypothetical protein
MAYWHARLLYGAKNMEHPKNSAERFNFGIFPTCWKVFLYVNLDKFNSLNVFYIYLKFHIYIFYLAIKLSVL